MKELSLHILDVVQNSIDARASMVKIFICEDTKKDIFSIQIVDNGVGMKDEVLKKIQDPFYTTRKTRRVGLGIPLLAQAVRACEGDFLIDSKVGVGTKVIAIFKRSHIDRAPLGRMDETMLTLAVIAPDVNFIYKHVVDNKEFVYDTRIIKRELQGVPINQPIVLEWIKDFVKEGIQKIGGGV